MRTFRVFLGWDSTPTEKIYQLPPQASHHLSRVLRINLGDQIEVFDGKGGRFEAKVVEIGKQVAVELMGVKPSQTESTQSIHLMIAVGKGDKMDWIIQKATELGVNKIIPLITARTEVRLPDDRWRKKQIHWQEIVINACEQCERDVVPAVLDVASLTTRLQEANNGLKLLLHPDQSSQKIKTIAATVSSTLKEPVHILIGPEGGFDNKEVQNALAHGFKPASLGPRILRMETAVVASLAIVQAVMGDI